MIVINYFFTSHTKALLDIREKVLDTVNDYCCYCYCCCYYYYYLLNVIAEESHKLLALIKTYFVCISFCVYCAYAVCQLVNMQSLIND